MVGWGRSWDVGLSLGGNGNSLVCDLGDVAVNMVSSVANLLDTAVGEGNRVRAAHDSVSIRGLSSIEVGLGVVISDSIGVGVGLRCLLVGRLMVSRGSIRWGSMGNDRGSIGWGSMGNDRGSVDSMSNRSVVSNDWGSVHSMSEGSSMDSVVQRGNSNSWVCNGMSNGVGKCMSHRVSNSVSGRVGKGMGHRVSNGMSKGVC